MSLSETKKQQVSSLCQCRWSESAVRISDFNRHLSEHDIGQDTHFAQFLSTKGGAANFCMQRFLTGLVYFSITITGIERK